LRGGADEHLAAGGADAAEGIPVDGRGGAAAGALGAESGFVEVGLLDANGFPIDVEFIGDDHRETGLHALPDLGIFTHDGDGAVGSDTDEGKREKDWGRLRCRRLRRCGESLGGRLEMIGEEKAASGNGGDTKKSATIEERGVHGTSWSSRCISGKEHLHG
jgi:hypothetical protein